MQKPRIAKLRNAMLRHVKLIQNDAEPSMSKKLSVMIIPQLGLPWGSYLFVKRIGGLDGGSK